MAYGKAGRYGPEALLSKVSTGLVQDSLLPVNVYLPGTTTLASLWTSAAKTSSAANPVSTDGNGNLAFYADPGYYDLNFTPVGGAATTISNILVPVDPTDPTPGTLGNGTYLAPVFADTYLLGNGTDESSAFQTLLNAASGKTVYFTPGKTYRADSALKPPAGYFKFRSLGGPANAVNPDGTTGAVLDLRFAGYRLQCLQAGVIDIDGSIVFTNGGTSAGTFILCTLTQPRINGTTFRGRSAVTGATCDEDAIQLGQTDATVTAGVLTSAFGGYGGWIRHTINSHIRRGAYLRTFADGVDVDGLYADGYCGSPNAGTGSAAFVEIDPTTGGGRFANGNFVRNLTVEAGNYNFPVAVRGAAASNIIGPLSVWDASAQTVADVRIESSDNTYDSSGFSSAPARISDGTSGQHHVVANKPQAFVLAANASSATTATYSTVFTTGNVVPRGSSVLVTVLGNSSNTTGSAYNSFQVVSGAKTVLAGSVSAASNAGLPFTHAVAAVFTGLTPGTPVTFSVQVKVSAGTWNCRPVAYPDTESLIVVVEEVL